MSVYTKAKSLGLLEEREKDVGKRAKAQAQNQKFIIFTGRRIPVANSPSRPRTLKDGKPIRPESAETYISAKYGDSRGAAYKAMVKLARFRPPAKLTKEAFHLYEEFRPSIPSGVAGWGKVSILDLVKTETTCRLMVGARPLTCWQQSAFVILRMSK